MTSRQVNRHHSEVDVSELENGDRAERPSTSSFQIDDLNAGPVGDPLTPALSGPRRKPHQTRWDKTWPKDPAAPDQPAEPEEVDEPKVRSKWRTPLRILGLLVMLGIIAWALNGKLPKPSEIWNALLTANWLWVLVGAVAMVISVASFAEQQRQLLAAFDTRISRRRITVITYGGTALTNSLPAGAAVSAGFSFTQYRNSGANRSTAATVMVLSGLLSIGSLAALYFLVIGAATATPFLTVVENNPVVTILIALIAAGIVLLLIRRTITGTPSEISERPTPRLDRWEARWPKLGTLARDGLDTLRQARLVRMRYLTLAIAWSLVKWAAEALCLLASCWAFDIQINLVSLSVVYLSVQLVRQVPLTPGGIGLVEAALLAGLVSSGAAHGPAAAAVLIYRLLSAWIIIPVGFGLLANMKRHDARKAAALQHQT